MTRFEKERLPGRRIEVIEHANGSTAELRLIMPQATFFCRVGHDEIRDKSGDVVKKWAKEMLGKQGAAIPWMPVIEVRLQSHDTRQTSYNGRTPELAGGLSVDLMRYAVARTQAGAWRMVPWPSFDPKRDSAALLRLSERWSGHHVADGDDLVLPIREKDHWQGSTTVMAYTPELWAGVTGVVQTLSAAEKQLRRFLGDDNALLALQEFALGQMLALPALPASDPKQYCAECDHALTDHGVVEGDEEYTECNVRGCHCIAFEAEP